MLRTSGFGQGTKPLARYVLRSKLLVGKGKTLQFPMLSDEAIRLVTQEEPGHDIPHPGY